MKVVSFSLEDGDKYFGKIDKTRFFIGRRVAFSGNKGLQNIVGSSAQRYDRGSHRQKFGFWADFIHSTAMAEGAFYHTLNTYDSARFTFSFLQFAAHVPNGDFVVFLKRLLALPMAAEYFPDLEVKDDRIYKSSNGGDVLLESDETTNGLLDYLNPTFKDIEDTEIIQAARLVHWAQNDAAHRDVQVEIGVTNFKKKLYEYSKQYGLDGKDPATCVVVADIRHQGRAKSPAIAAALAKPNPLLELLKIGEGEYPERIKVLKRELKVLSDDGTFNGFQYSQNKKEFVKNS